MGSCDTFAAYCTCGVALTDFHRADWVFPVIANSRIPQAVAPVDAPHPGELAGRSKGGFGDDAGRSTIAPRGGLTQASGWLEFAPATVPGMNNGTIRMP